MSDERPQLDVWRIGSALLWVFFFLLGLQPENTFYAFRMLSGVVTARAYVNSPYVIMWALAGYLVIFAYRACRDAGLTPDESRGKATQLGLLALLAFFPYRFEQALDYRQIAMAMDRYVNVAFALAKCLAWLYLLWVVGRYEFTEGNGVFIRMQSLFPSARAQARREAVEEAPPPEPAQNPSEE